MFDLLCADLEAARLNRERIARGETNRFYDEQAHILAQWTSEKPPADLILGELPYAGKIRLDNKE